MPETRDSLSRQNDREVERHVRNAIDGVLLVFIWMPAVILAWHFGWMATIAFAVGALVSSAMDLRRAWKAANR